MVSRYSLCAPVGEVAARFHVEEPIGYVPYYNAAPTHLLPVITQESPQGVSFFYWGAPPAWANKKALGEKIINTASELIPENGTLKKKMKGKRCLIPADGFYEWKKTGKRTAIPYRFTRMDKSLFSIAGLWEEYDNEQGETFHTFTVITTPANDSVAAIHDRMPLILNSADEQTWLSSDNDDQLFGLLQVSNEAFDHYSVSPLVNDPEKNSKLIILPAPPSDQFGNLTLFD